MLNAEIIFVKVTSSAEHLDSDKEVGVIYSCNPLNEGALVLKNIEDRELIRKILIHSIGHTLIVTNDGIKMDSYYTLTMDDRKVVPRIYVRRMGTSILTVSNAWSVLTDEAYIVTNKEPGTIQKRILDALI